MRLIQRSPVVPIDVGQYVDKPTIATEAGRKAAGVRPLPGSPQARGGELTKLPARFMPPPTAQDFSASANQSVGPGPTTVVIATFVIPRGSIGVIRSIVFNINNMLATTIVSLAFTINEAPAPGWSYNIFPRAAASVAVSFGPEETFIKIPDGSLCGFQVTVTDAGTYLVGGTFHGWHFSKSVAQEYGI